MGVWSAGEFFDANVSESFAAEGNSSRDVKIVDIVTSKELVNPAAPFP